jgi:hypothetical protein
MSFSCNNIITIIKDNISLAFSPGKKIVESELALILSTAVKFNTSTVVSHVIRPHILQ